jgi:hypothetical protein
MGYLLFSLAGVFAPIIFSFWWASGYPLFSLFFFSFVFLAHAFLAWQFE